MSQKQLISSKNKDIAKYQISPGAPDEIINILATQLTGLKMLHREF